MYFFYKIIQIIINNIIKVLKKLLTLNYCICLYNNTSYKQNIDFSTILTLLTLLL